MNRFIITTLILLAGQDAAAQISPLHARYNPGNQHTYVLTPVGMTWQTARIYSRTLGGHLVTINDASEQAFLASSYAPLQQPCWIGLSDAATEGVFLWDSGEPVTYTNWCAGQPDDWNGIEDYGEIFSAHTGLAPCWNDLQSPTTYAAPTQGIVELALGDRVNFDSVATGCGSSPFPTPLGATSNPEGVSWNGAGAAGGRYALVSSIPEDGMPVSGTQYLRMSADGIIGLAFGGVAPRPLGSSINEVRVAIPPGTQGVSLAWELIARESPLAMFNDGMDISVVDATGHLIAPVVHADMAFTAGIDSTGAYCSDTGGTHILPAGPQVASVALPPLPFPAYLSIACWNGYDNNFPSVVHVDAIHFWGFEPFRLTFSAPFGPGSIRLQNAGGGAGNSYWTAVTLDPGSFPNGWFFGVDISAAGILGEIAMGVPFAGTLDASGSSTFTIPSGVPSGLDVYAVSLQFANGGSFVGASAPEHFATP